MQPADGFQYDGGPMNGAHGHQIPAGSRLNQYLANNSRQAFFSGPSFGPGTPINVNAPVFIPKHQQPQQQPTPPQSSPMLNQFAQLAIHDVPHQMIPFTQVNAGPQPYGPIPHLNQRQQHHPSPLPSQQTPQPTPYDRYQQESRGGTIYFYPEAGEQHPEEEHYAEAEIPEGTVLVATPGAFVYSAPLPMAHMARFRGKANANLQTQFISPELRVELLNRQLAFETKVDPNYYTDIPQAVEHYSNLVPLEPTTIQNQSQSTYKAFSCRDGNFYCLRRIHEKAGHRVQHPGKQTHAIEQWKKIVHGNIVPLREILINCRAFEDSSLIFVYDYYPLAETLMARHFDCKAGTFYDPTIPDGFKLASPMTVPLPVGGSGMSETILWTYIVQISMALRAIHTSGLACRSVDLNKIVSYGNKVLLSFCGIQDLINPDPHSIQHNQNEDLIQFGNILIALASGRPNGWRRDLMQASMKHIHDVYSLDLRNVIAFLLNTNSTVRRTINEIMPMIGARFFAVIEHMQMKSDQMEAELTRELENGRLFRLLAKMNTVLERVEHGSDEGWSETGDRFMLKLFRDYVFHQVTDQGKAWLDMAHIIQCLNKLDSGSMEKIEMVSRNGETQIIIDYSTLKRCLDKSFRELLGTNMMHRH